MNRPTRVILTGEAQSEFNRLNELVGQQIKESKESTEEIQLFRSIKQKTEFIKANPFYGDNIPKNLIPKQYAVSNLWRVELSQFWRMLYTIKGDQIEIICFILEIVNHSEYNDIFKYKRR